MLLYHSIKAIQKAGYEAIPLNKTIPENGFNLIFGFLINAYLTI